MIERSIVFGRNAALVGTTCIPRAETGEASGIGLILFNAGVVHRIGPHRINVRLARRLARRGIPSIRFDLAGQGDSQRAPGDLPYEKQAVADIRAAMDALETGAGVRRFALFGFCSGGWHSYATASVDERVAGIFLYDTYFFPTWKTRVIRHLVPIRQRGLLKVALAATANRVWRLLGRRGPGAGSGNGSSRSPGLVNAPPRSEFAERIRIFHERGTRVAVAHSGGFEHYNYRDQFREAFGRYGILEMVDFLYFPSMGHTATQLRLQAEFMSSLEEWVESVGRRRPGPAADPGL